MLANDSGRLTGNPEGTLPNLVLTGVIAGAFHPRHKIHAAHLTPLDAPAIQLCAPVPAHRKSAAGT
jgi:hypothetical protein